MLNLRRQSRELRALSLVVAVFQLASVTWVPIVHPIIHPDRSLSTPISALDIQTSGGEQQVLGETLCVACTVSANAMPTPFRFLAPTEPVLKQQLPRESAGRFSLQAYFPTHAARAPPSH